MGKVVNLFEWREQKQLAREAALQQEEDRWTRELRELLEMLGGRDEKE